MKIKIAPSILAADFSKLGLEIENINSLDIDFLHIDIMDGHFVPNISIGPAVVKAIRPLCQLPFEAHLMISQPLEYVDRFVEAGANIITFHIETISSRKFQAAASRLRKNGIKAALALNPGTDAFRIKALAGFADMILVMTVNPGFGGQKFMAEVVPKISQIRSFFKGDLAVDGGIDDTNSPIVLKAGANVLACGTYFFKAKNKPEAIERLKKCLI